MRPLPPCCTPIGCLGVKFDSQLTGIHKTPQQTNGSFCYFIEKSPKTAFFDKNL
jgi:hypothetical protein